VAGCDRNGWPDVPEYADQSAAYIESLKPLHSISAGTPNLEIADASMKPLFHLGLLRLQ
jgi:hypothetical protein